MDNLVYKIALTQIPGVGDVLTRNLVSYCGGVEEVFKQKKSRLLQIPGIGEMLANNIVQFKNFKPAETEIKFIEKHGIKCMFYLDKEYPNRLKNYTDAPVMLYSLGNTNYDNEKIVGIVGTRKASDYGKSFTEELVETLVPTGALIISGLALGIDGAAHRSALKHHLSTVGVMAHGLDRIYPAAHKNIAKQMLENGGLLTEFTSGTIPDRENFPKRNRIVAGMCDALVVVESKRGGGSLITATIANSYNKDVFAFPGNAGEVLAEGCNGLIKRNRAALIENAEDLLFAMQW